MLPLYSYTYFLRVPTLRSPSSICISLQRPLRPMKRNSTTTTSSSRRKIVRPSLESPTLQPSTSSRSRVHREGFSYHWIFRSNIPKRRSLLFPNEIQKRNFFGMGEVFGVLANVRVFLPFLRISFRSSHTLCPACTNSQIPNGSQKPARTDPRRVDGSQGTSTDQANTHLLTFTTLCVFPSADRSQGNRERSSRSAQLDCHFWRQFDRKGTFRLLRYFGVH